jgi:hypothetical protein
MVEKKYTIPEYSMLSDARADAVIDTEYKIQLQCGSRLSYFMPLTRNSGLMDILRQGKSASDIIDENAEAEINKMLEKVTPKILKALTNEDREDSENSKFEGMQMQLVRLDGIGVGVEILSRIAYSREDLVKVRTEVRMTLPDTARGIEKELEKYEIKIDDNALTRERNHFAAKVKEMLRKYDLTQNSDERSNF